MNVPNATKLYNKSSEDGKFYVMCILNIIVKNKKKPGTNGTYYITQFAENSRIDKTDP